MSKAGPEWAAQFLDEGGVIAIECAAVSYEQTAAYVVIVFSNLTDLPSLSKNFSTIVCQRELVMCLRAVMNNKVR
jgi:hypothetical protein